MSENTDPEISDEVLQAIFTEWRYQDSLNVSGCEDKSTAEVLLMLEEYIKIMRNKWVFKKGDGPANEELRKITTMCLRAMHAPGRAVPRTQFPDLKF